MTFCRKCGNRLQVEDTCPYCDKIKSMKLSNFKRAEKFYKQGLKFFNLGGLKDAILKLNKALKIFPEFTEVLADKGAILIRLQRYEEGLDALNKALEYKPNYTIALTNKKYLSNQLKNKGIDIKILEKKGKIEINCHKCGKQVFYGENYCYACGTQIGKIEVADEKVCEIFLDLIYNEKFDQAIKCLENQIYPLVAQGHAFGKVNPMNKFVSIKFTAEKENHLIKDEDNLIKFQSGKYNWKSYIPKGKFVKIYNGLYWSHSYTVLSMNELERKFFHRDELVKFVLKNFFSTTRLFHHPIFGEVSQPNEKMLITAIDTPKESISIFRSEKITVYVTEQHPGLRLQTIKAMIKHNIENIPMNWILKEIMHVAHLRDSDIKDLLAEKKEQSGKEWDEQDAIIEIALERGVDIRNKTLDDFIEEVDFNSVPLSDFYPIFESENREMVDEQKKVELFEKIGDKIDVSDNFAGLLDLITHSRDPRDYQADNPLDYRHGILLNFYSKVSKNYPEVLIENFPEILVTNRKLVSAAQIMTFEIIIHRIKNTDIMKKHFNSIEDEFKKLLEFFYSLPYDSVKYFHSKSDLFTRLKTIISGTDLLQSDIPNFSKLIKYYPSYKDEELPLVKDFDYYSQPGGEPLIDYTLKRIETFELNFLLSLYGVIKGQKLMEVQYKSLITIFDRLLDKFDEIQRDDDAFTLFSMFYEALNREKSAATQETLLKKISKFTKNLSIIEEKYPEMWEEYDRCSKDQSNELLSDLFIYFTRNGVIEKVLFPPREWKEGPEFLDLLESKIPNFAKLIEPISWDESTFGLGKFALLSLTDLVEGNPLTEEQWSYLVFLSEMMIDNFYKIQLDKDSIQLFNAVSSFVKILLQKKPELIKQIFINKILLFTANLNALKNRFPKEWNESLNHS